MPTIKKFLHQYFNSFLVCTLIGLAFYVVPAIMTKPSENIITASRAQIAITNAANIADIPASSWREQALPYSVEKNGTKGGSAQWIKITFNDAAINSDVVDVLIKNLPHGGKIFLNGELVENLEQSTDQVQVLNFEPVLLRYKKNRLQPIQTLEIQSFIGFSFSAIEPIYIGTEAEIKRLYRAYNNWNNVYLTVISSLCACVALVLLAILVGDFKNRALRVFTALAILWPAWLMVSTAQYVPYQLWELWRIAIGFLAIGLFYTTAEVVFIVARRGMPKFIWLFYIGLLPIVILAAYLNDRLLWLSQTVVILQIVGVVYTIGFILYLASKQHSWKLWTLLIFLSWTSIASIHDILSWLGWWPKHYALLQSLGVPEFWLQSKTATHLVVFPTLLLISVEAVLAIRASFRMQAAIKSAAQEERARITMDLHDSLGATLTMGNLQSQNGQLTIDAAKQVIAEAMNDLRLILNGFSQDVPNLIAIIETIAEQSKKALSHNKSVTIEYYVPLASQEPNVSAKTAINLSKIMREAITNAAKYANCTDIFLSMTYLEREILVCVQDNGQGFDVAEKTTQKHQGRGLKNMLSRAHESGGRIEFQSQPGQTIVSIYMPMSDLNYRTQ